MTYRDLAKKINAMSADKQDNDISVLLLGSNEVLEIFDFVTDDWTEDDEQNSDYFARGVDKVAGVLDDGHPFLTIDF